MGLLKKPDKLAKNKAVDASSSAQAAKPASKTAAKNKNRNRDDELPSPPDCSGNTLLKQGMFRPFCAASISAKPQMNIA
jgi:hypothetical protein